jgi:hypothetical protein
MTISAFLHSVCHLRLRINENQVEGESKLLALKMEQGNNFIQVISCVLTRIAAL